MTNEQNATGLSKPKLLLADDSVTIRKVVELTFADEGVDVTTVGSGEEAMQKFVEIEPDIVLVDVNMPDPTGYHICEMIKQDESTRHIPVLLLVGSFEPFDQDEAERVGADGFMVKPFQSIRELVAKVSELLGPDKEPVLIRPETSDIDNLYMNSFAEPDRIEDSATSDVFLGDVGLDDEMIETVHPSGDHIEAISEPAAESGEILRGFDWSAAPVDEPEPSEQARSNGAFEAPLIIEEEEQSEPFEEEGHEPVEERQWEHVEEEHGEQGDGEHGEFVNEERHEPVEEVRHEPVEEVRPEPVEEVRHEPVEEVRPEPVEEVRHEPVEEVRHEPVEEVRHEPVEELRHEPVEEDPLEVGHQESDEELEVDTLRDMEVSEPAADNKLVDEPSDEFVNRVARLVVEKLSDRVIREIAREAVPRIAENLIREALEEENKS